LIRSSITPAARSAGTTAYGYIMNYPVERYWRDARLCEMGEGTSAIQRLVITRQLLQTTQKRQAGRTGTKDT
jgi:alkylation response protein AidB-like acyl-CoA dehydrogenase